MKAILSEHCVVRLSERSSMTKDQVVKIIDTAEL